MEDNELDLVVFVDDDDNEVTMEVLDYFFYEGQEYAVLTEYQEDAEETEAPLECVIMRVDPVGDDEEEFLPVEEALAERLIELYQQEADEEDDEEE